MNRWACPVCLEQRIGVYARGLVQSLVPNLEERESHREERESEGKIQNKTTTGGKKLRFQVQTIPLC